MNRKKEILVKQQKAVLNKHSNKDIEVAIAEIRRIDNDVHFVLSFGVGQRGNYSRKRGVG